MEKITISQFKIYEKYYGNVHQFLSKPTQYEMSIMSKAVWDMIDYLVEISILSRDYENMEFKSYVSKQINEFCDADIIDKVMNINKKKLFIK